MGDTVNLTALAEDRAKMTPEWTSDVWQNTNEGGWAAVGPHHKHDGACDEPGDPAHGKAVADATGIVAEHNAIGVLIEVARAALRLKAARATTQASSSDPGRDGKASEFTEAFRAERIAAAGLDAALAKVSL